MLRDVLIASMSKGQFPLALLALIFVVMILKMPQADVSKLVFEIFQLLKQGYYVGYALSALTIGGWFMHARWQRRVIDSEMARIAQERDRYQKAQMKAAIESSEAR